MPVSDAMHRGDLIRRIESLERLVRELSSSRRLEHSAVGEGGIRLHDGGGITVDDGGEVVVRSATGNDLVYIGPDEYTGVPSWRLSYDHGRPAVTTIGTAGRQYVALIDLAGRLVMSTDTASGTGLARPYLAMRMVPSWEAEISGDRVWPSTESTSPVKIMQGINPVFQPKVSIGIATASAGATAHWRVEINNRTVATGTGTGSATVTVPGWGDEILPGDAVGMDLYAWASGGGRVWVQVDRLYGRQS